MVSMSLTLFSLITTTGIVFILFSCSFAAVCTNIDDDGNGDGHHNGADGAKDAHVLNYPHQPSSRLEKEDNIGHGSYEQREEVIREAAVEAAEKQFAIAGYLSGEQLAPEVAHAQTYSQAVDGNGRPLLADGGSFSSKQDLNDDSFISATTSPYSVNKSRPVTVRRFDKHAAAVAAAAATVKLSKINPLIESDVSNVVTAAIPRLRHRNRRAANNTIRHRPHGHQIDGFKYWCHRDCDNAKRSHVCASDGRLYGSLCELLRHSCRHNVALFKRSASHCAPQMDRNMDGAIAVDDDDDDENDNDDDDGDGDGDDEGILASNLNEPPLAKDERGQDVNIVKLKGRCNRAELEKMKLLLLRQFGGDIETIFESFDSNNDQFIEAHELWPKRDITITTNNSNSKSLYAQVWDEHSSKCRLGHSGLRYHINGDRSKCWFFLDFVFEPKYPPNPCSLSHLILFDLKHPTSRFTLNTFQQAFQNVLATLHDDTTNNSIKLKQDQFKLFKRTTTTRLYIGLGKTVKLDCLPNSTFQIGSIRDNLIDEYSDEISNLDGAKCLWTRYNSNMAAKFDTHISVKRQNVFIENKKNFHDLTLHIRDAQLYLSGQFKCSCKFDRIEHNFEHIYNVQVLAEPRVNVRPKFQWSLPHSRISFECQYDHIDTSFGDKLLTSVPKDAFKYNLNETDEANGQFGIQIKWLKENQNLIVDSKKFANINSDASYMSSKPIEEKTQSSWLATDQDHQFYSPQDELAPINMSKANLSSSSLRASITMAASRLTLENLQLDDTGHHTCRVEVPAQLDRLNSSATEASIWLLPINNNDNKNNNDQANVLVGEANGSLLVQEQPITEQSDDGDRLDRTSTYLWMFHDNGISVYKVQNDDGQEMELVREINGHSMASGEVDGNWNQLTLCGGLNTEQVVICEWSDNAVRVEVNQVTNDADVANDRSSKTSLRKYVYVGQPNLNRIVVLDGLRFEVVAIVNTEPQPRKLHLYKPNKVHLSKWVRRRLSPVANARWMAAIGTHAHSLKSTPADSRLYSNEPSKETLYKETEPYGHRDRRRDRRRAFSSSTNQLPSALIQHDIWLLCYGQPLVVDPSGDESSEEDAIANNFYSTLNSSSDNNTGPMGGSRQTQKLVLNTIQPFTPRISPPFMWSIWSNPAAAAAANNKESKIRNRKSVHIIQSTFFPQTPARRVSLHNHDEDNQADPGHEEGLGQGSQTRNHSKATTTFVGEFKRSTVLTTHHIFSSLTSLENTKTGKMYLKRPTNGHQLDLLQDLFVPSKPYSLELNNHHKIHYAYVTHYNERRLFRINMDEYRYDRAIDLENCDPINLMTTAQGLLIVQCRSLITHNLIGQLVLDQLTNSRIEFNGNIRAQEAFLSPDNRYLISIHNNSTLAPSGSLGNHDKGPLFGQRKRSSPAIEQRQQDHLRRQASIVYVQLVTVTGLELQYEIKTSLEMSQCSFVWKDGYYAAILVSTNRHDQQSEILSLRLADSRLELMARVSGVISRTRHKEQLIVSQELRLAALSTNQGTYVVDLEDNRVSQSLRYHQSPPTLLWV